MKLKARFEVNAPNTLFLSLAEKNKMPMSSMPLFL